MSECKWNEKEDPLQCLRELLYELTNHKSKVNKAITHTTWLLKDLDSGDMEVFVKWYEDDGHGVLKEAQLEIWGPRGNNQNGNCIWCLVNFEDITADLLDAYSLDKENEDDEGLTTIKAGAKFWADKFQEMADKIREHCDLDKEN